MESRVNQTDIHVGFINELGKVGIQCTNAHLCIFAYDRLSDRLELIKWDFVSEIRLNHHVGEVKFTFHSKVRKQIRLWLDGSQVLIRQMMQIGCIVKLRKWWPNVNGMLYYKPQDKLPVRELKTITEFDFVEHLKIAGESSVGMRFRSKKSTCSKVVAILDQIF